MGAPIVVCIHVSRGRRPSLDLSIHNAQELSEDDLHTMFPELRAMLRHGLKTLKNDPALKDLVDGRTIAEVVQ